jgi:hypothetical protein
LTDTFEPIPKIPLVFATLNLVPVPVKNIELLVIETRPEIVFVVSIEEIVTFLEVSLVLFKIA